MMKHEHIYLVQNSIYASCLSRKNLAVTLVCRVARHHFTQIAPKIEFLTNIDEWGIVEKVIDEALREKSQSDLRDSTRTKTETIRKLCRMVYFKLAIRMVMKTGCMT